LVQERIVEAEGAKVLAGGDLFELRSTESWMIERVVEGIASGADTSSVPASVQYLEVLQDHCGVRAVVVRNSRLGEAELGRSRWGLGSRLKVEVR